MPVNRATPEGTERYRERFADRAAKDHFRRQQQLTLSSIGIGTYLGNPDDGDRRELHKRRRSSGSTWL